MSSPAKRWTDPQADQRAERLVGRILQIGVLVSALVVLAGGVLYLAQNACEPAGHHEFHGEPERLRNLVEIPREAAQLHARGIVQFGILLLILTPVARVAFTALVFLAARLCLRRRDHVRLGPAVVQPVGRAAVAGIDSIVGWVERSEPHHPEYA